MLKMTAQKEYFPCGCFLDWTAQGTKPEAGLCQKAESERACDCRLEKGTITHCAHHENPETVKFRTTGAPLSLDRNMSVQDVFKVYEDANS